MTALSDWLHNSPHFFFTLAIRSWPTRTVHITPAEITNTSDSKGKGKVDHAPMEHRWGAHLPYLCREPTRRWINHLSLCRVVSVTPDLWLPSRPQSITTLWLVPNCTAWWQRHMGVNNLPRVVAWRCTGRESNPGPLDLESDMLTTKPPSHNQRIVRLRYHQQIITLQCNISYHISYIRP